MDLKNLNYIFLSKINLKIVTNFIFDETLYVDKMLY